MVKTHIQQGLILDEFALRRASIAYEGREGKSRASIHVLILNQTYDFFNRSGRGWPTVYGV